MTVWHLKLLEDAARNQFGRSLVRKLDQINRVREINELKVRTRSPIGAIKRQSGECNTVSALINNIEFVFHGRKAMHTRSKSQITTDVGRRLPRNRPPTHPGDMLFEEFITPLHLTQTELARRLGVSYHRLNEIIKGRRSVTPDTAVRLSRVLGMSADFWLGLQLDWDLWYAMNRPEAKQFNRLKPIPRDQHSFA